MTYVLQSTHQLGHQSVCTEVNVTAVCNREGKWEAVSDDGCSETSLSGNHSQICNLSELCILCSV